MTSLHPLLSLVCGACAVLPATACAGETDHSPGVIEVRLHGGRTLTGEVDPATDDATLCLRLVGPRIVIESRTNWSDVLWIGSIGINGPAWDAESLRAWARSRRIIPASGERPADGTADGPSALEAAPPPPPPGSPWSPETGLLGVSVPGILAPPLPPVAMPVRGRWPPTALLKVESLSIDVRTGNWDADPAQDGLVVRLFPRAANGALVPVLGSVRVRLMGRRISKGGERAPPTGDRLFFDAASRRTALEAAHWSAPVRPWHFDDWGAVHHLPWQRIDPQTDAGIGADGHVLVELGVTGGRTFRATAPVRLRPAGGSQ